MSGDLYAPRRSNRGVWAALGASAILHVLTLSLLVLAFQSRSPLPHYAPEAGEGELVGEGHHGRALSEMEGSGARRRLQAIVGTPVNQGARGLNIYGGAPGTGIGGANQLDPLSYMYVEQVGAGYRLHLLANVVIDPSNQADTTTPALTVNQGSASSGASFSAPVVMGSTLSVTGKITAVTGIQSNGDLTVTGTTTLSTTTITAAAGAVGLSVVGNGLQNALNVGTLPLGNANGNMQVFGALTTYQNSFTFTNLLVNGDLTVKGTSTLRNAIIDSKAAPGYSGTALVVNANDNQPGVQIYKGLGTANTLFTDGPVSLTSTLGVTGKSTLGVVDAGATELDSLLVTGATQLAQTTIVVGAGSGLTALSVTGPNNDPLTAGAALSVNGEAYFTTDYFTQRGLSAPPSSGSVSIGSPTGFLGLVTATAGVSVTGGNVGLANGVNLNVGTGSTTLGGTLSVTGKTIIYGETTIDDNLIVTGTLGTVANPIGQLIANSAIINNNLAVGGSITCDDLTAATFVNSPLFEATGSTGTFVATGINALVSLTGTGASVSVPNGLVTGKTVTGTTTVNSPLVEATGATGTFLATGANAQFNGPSAAATFETLSVTNGASIANGLTVTGGASITGGITVTGGASITGAVGIGGDVAMVGDVGILGDLTADGDSTFIGSVKITADNGKIALDITGDLTAPTTTALHVDGDTVLEQDLTVNGDTLLDFTQIDAPADSVGLVINGETTGSAPFSPALVVNGRSELDDTDVDGDLSVTGTSSLRTTVILALAGDDALTVTAVANQYAIVSDGGAQLVNTIPGNPTALEVAGKSVLVGQTSVTGKTTVTSLTNTEVALTVNGAADGTTALKVNGPSDLDDLTAADTTVGDLTADATVVDSLDSAGAVNVAGTLTVAGKSTLANTQIGTLAVTGKSTLTGLLTANGGVTTTTLTATNVVTRDLTATGGTVVINGATVTVTGTATFNGGSTFNGLVTMNEDVSMAKNLNVAGTTNIATNLNVQKITTLGTNVNPTPTPLVVRGSANIGNQIAASVATFTGQTTTKTLVVNAGASFTSERPGSNAITSNGPVLVKSNVTSNGKMTANQGFVTAASLIARQCACANYPAAPFQGQSS